MADLILQASAERNGLFPVNDLDPSEAGEKQCDEVRPALLRLRTRRGTVP